MILKTAKSGKIADERKQAAGKSRIAFES
jgi:hypothetical protein